VTADSLTAYRFLEKQFHVLGVHLRAQQVAVNLQQRDEKTAGSPVDAQWPDEAVPSSLHTVRGMLQMSVDFRFPQHSPAGVREHMVQVVPPTLPGPAHSPADFVPRGGVYALKHLPGFYFAPGALDETQQEYWCQRALLDFIERPNRRNLDVDAGMKASRGPGDSGGGGNADSRYPSKLWQSYQQWVSELSADEAHSLHFETPRSGGVVDDVSWATLGWQYDWGTRQYLMPPQSTQANTESTAGSSASEHIVPMPQDMREFGRQAAAAVGESLEAHAGIVNYYKLTASMGGHQDIAEQTYEHPVIGMSIGCGGVFLMGGETKDAAPLPVLLRSGDVLFMGGVTRLCYHGVACMLPGTAPAQLFAPIAEPAVPADTEAQAQRAALRHWVMHHRLNMNVRQVLPDGTS